MSKPSELRGSPIDVEAALSGGVRWWSSAIFCSTSRSHGAHSWRPSHPHPVFSPDGKRIYDNVSDGEFTRPFVAEIE